MTIKDLDLGRLDAERDRNLADYFVDTGAIGRLARGEKQYVVGRKGSGKTVLFTVTTEEAFGRPVLRLDFDDYPWDAHRAVREEGMYGESAYFASWKFTLLVTIVREWALHAEEALAEKAYEHLGKIFGGEEPGPLQILFDKLKRIRRIDLPSAGSIGSLGGFELDDIASAGPELARSLSRWNKVLGDFVAGNFAKRPVSVMLDRLDDAWDASDDSKALLVGVLRAARDVNLKISSNSGPATCIVFLRSDIYDELRFNDKNKMQADIEFIEWDDTRLVQVVEARIGRSFSCPPAGSWDRVFSALEMRQRAKPQTYILKRCMGRPRDIVAFVMNCKEAAVRAGHDVVEKDDIYEAEEHFSRHIYDELDDEMHKQLPRAKEYLQVLRDLRQTKFSLRDWVNACQARDAEVDATEAHARLKVLFDYSVVGVQRAGGVTGGTKWLFRYNDRLLEPDFDRDVVVHPSLKKHLKLIDLTGGAAARGGEGRPDDESESADE